MHQELSNEINPLIQQTVVLVQLRGKRKVKITQAYAMKEDDLTGKACHCGYGSKCVKRKNKK